METSLSKLYLALKPRKELQGIISEIWIQQTPKGSESMSPTRVIPSGFPEMTFFYFHPVYEISENGNKDLPRCSINGQKTRYKEYGSQKNVGSIIFRFNPWGLSSIFPNPAKDFTDKNIDLKDTLKPSMLDQIEESLLGNLPLLHKIHPIEDILFKMFQSNRRDLRWMNHITQIIAKSKGRIPIEKLCMEHQIGRRTLEKRFQETLGLSPKTFASILRFQSSIQSLEKDLNYLDYYYDQSHYIRNIKRFTGHTPESLIKVKSKSLLDGSFNKDSHLYNTVYLNSSTL